MHCERRLVLIRYWFTLLAVFLAACNSNTESNTNFDTDTDSVDTVSYSDTDTKTNKDTDPGANTDSDSDSDADTDIGGCPSPLPNSTTSADNLNFGGTYYTSNWRGEPFDGSAFRAWSDDAACFQYTWDNTSGGQIGRLGKPQGSSGLGVLVDDIRADAVMSTNATVTNLASTGYYIWSIYGWTHSVNEGWVNPNGWNNEFYIVFQSWNDSFDGPIINDPSFVSIGSVTVDGLVFDCYTHDMPWGTPNQTQWVAHARAQMWNASVNLAPIFAHWRSQGLPNDYVVDLAWALEVGAVSSGEIALSNIQIPPLD